MKKNKNGFTLVELLAVIVILAIIMIIAIPSVLNTMKTARSKSMIEYAQKVMNKAEEIYMEKQLVGDPFIRPTDYTEIFFDITKDLGISSSGDFKGIVALAVYPDKLEKVVCIYDKERVLSYGTEFGELNTSYIQPVSNINSMFPDGKTLDDVNIKRWTAYATYITKCNNHNASSVDASTNRVICGYNDPEPESLNNPTICYPGYTTDKLVETLQTYFSNNEYADVCTGI